MFSHVHVAFLHVGTSTDLERFTAFPSNDTLTRKSNMCSAAPRRWQCGHEAAFLGSVSGDGGGPEELELGLYHLGV